jgi:hypothetical protein
MSSWPLFEFPVIRHTVLLNLYIHITYLGSQAAFIHVFSKHELTSPFLIMLKRLLREIPYLLARSCWFVLYFTQLFNILKRKTTLDCGYLLLINCCIHWRAQRDGLEDKSSLLYFSFNQQSYKSSQPSYELFWNRLRHSLKLKAPIHSLWPLPLPDLPLLMTAVGGGRASPALGRRQYVCIILTGIIHSYWIILVDVGWQSVILKVIKPLVI